MSNDDHEERRERDRRDADHAYMIGQLTQEVKNLREGIERAVDDRIEEREKFEARLKTIEEGVATVQGRFDEFDMGVKFVGRLGSFLRKWLPIVLGVIAAWKAGDIIGGLRALFRIGPP